MASVGSQDPFDLGSSSPPPRPSDGKRSWEELRHAIKKSHRAASSIMQKSPHTFTFRHSNSDGGKQSRLYFLGVASGSRENSLMYADIPEGYASKLQWKPLLESFQTTPMQGQFSKEEQLLRERKRLRAFGITAYDYEDITGSFAFPASSSLFVSTDSVDEHGSFLDTAEFPLEVRSKCSGARLDPKLCPGDPNIVAFINKSDLWVANVSKCKDARLTHTHKGYTSSIKDDPKSAGIPSFVVQEEFDRYTGYWWQPCTSTKGGEREVYRILYEEVDEGDVDIHNIVSTSSEGSSIDEYRYPKAGTENASSTLKLVEFEVDGYGAITNIMPKQLSQPLDSVFPWMEYLLQAGWTPDGKFVYAVVIDRQQRRLQVVLIPLQCFVSPGEATAMDLTAVQPSIQVIYEDTSNVWMHVHDIFHILPCESPEKISFIWASEQSGFVHLYHVTSRLTGAEDGSSAMDLIDKHFDSLQPSVEQVRQLTTGDWEVDCKQIWIDECRKLIYFVGYKDTPLETHLYVVSYDNPGSVVRLTEEGFSHSITMDKECSLFVSVYSNVRSAPASQVFRVHHDSDRITAQAVGWMLETSSMPEYIAPELFSYPSQSGFTMHGMVFKPHNALPGQKYPVLQFVYGGPQVQLVSNAYKGVRFLRLHTLARLGYVVVVIDSRGSCHRGLKFESHLKDRLGQVEIGDQVEGLEWLAQQVDYVDINRVAIHGWSYGGYLSLLGLAQRPDIYKIAIAGAPVTSWFLYDTGYTERYMDLPDNNREGYRAGSVLTYINHFPDEENRLLLVHGLIDENVHFLHTSTLVNSLVKACKPYQLQVYPNERHGIRNPDANEHYETMMLNFLQQNL